MEEVFTILIADRNPHVRDLLLRELRAEGYYIRVARNAKDIMAIAHPESPIDILILDLGIPDIEQTYLITWLNNRTPPLPVVIHSFFSDYEIYVNVLTAIAFVEKNENSVEQLKRVLSNLTRQRLTMDQPEIAGTPSHSAEP